VDTSSEHLDETAPEPPASAETPAAPASRRDPVDLDQIEADLAGAESALERLDAGTYWTDEVTGEPIPDDVLTVDPVARRAR
jgi:RNA polymerase-binding transcription factor DksA